MRVIPGSPRRSTQRLLLMTPAGLLGGIGSYLLGSGLLAAVVVGWGVACLTYLVRVWVRIWGMDAERTRTHAWGEEPNRTTADLLLLLASVASVAAVVVVMLQSRPDVDEWLPTNALALTSLLITWTFIHTLYTLRYASMYYSDPGGGIDFNGDDHPCYTDFAYLAFALGMSFQVPDLKIRNSRLRRVVLVHTLLSYLFSTMVLGATVNLVANLVSG